VVTQFSSVAIEAGFHGIPSLSVLLPDAGSARLFEKKGYRVPPYCESGAAALVSDAGAVEETLIGTLGDCARRENIIRCFDAYFDIGTLMLPPLVALLTSVLITGKIGPKISDFM
jgi:hypothetical protein